jgi:class 3 adenylate cyclase
MGLFDELEERVGAIFRTPMEIRSGRVVPEPDDIALVGDAVELDATLLYADLAESTRMVEVLSEDLAARIYQTFAYCSCRIISEHGGVVTSFDGDRVMAAFVGEFQEGDAVWAAMKIAYAVGNLLNPMVVEFYKSFAPRLRPYCIRHACGVDAGTMLVTRTGMRGANDLVWVGRPANYAAKLSAVRRGYTTYCTPKVYRALDKGLRTDAAGRLAWVKWREPAVDMEVLGTSLRVSF